MRLLTLSLLAVGLMFTMPAEAMLGSNKQKIAVLDFQAVLEQAEVAQAANTELSAKTRETQEQLVAMETELRQRQAELQEQRSVMNDEQFEEARVKLEADVRAYQAEAQELRVGLDREIFTKRNEIIGQIREVVTDMAEKAGYDMVIPSTATIYIADTLDITAEAIEAVNAELN